MANEWNKTAFVEFEAMLRRRLRSGAAPVTACAGFDLDAASAYLEDALGGSHRAGYESHLAGCAACRRHLIELSRLTQITPQAEAPPAPVTDQTPAWLRWREVVAGWFDLSAWNLKWRITGATGAAFAILIAALGVQSWRQSHNQAAIAINASRTPAILAEPGVQPVQMSNPESSPLGAFTSVYDNLALDNQGQSPNPVPTPHVGLRVDASAPVFTDSDRLSTLSLNQPVDAPIATRPGGPEAGPNPPPQPRSGEESASVSDASGPVLFRRDSNGQAAKDIVQAPRITPPEGYNPMNPGQPEYETLARVHGRMPPTPPKSRLETRSLPDRIRRRLLSLPKFGFNSESGRREKSDKQEASVDESPKPMLIPIRDKVFRFEKGMLIDREYNPDMQKWRVWTLKRGSDAYKQVLANEPLLKEFFDRGPILIVWKNRIYKVL